MMEGILIWLIVGGIAGWLAGLIVKGGGQGIVVNIIVGIVGAVIGGWLFAQLGVAVGTGLINSIVTAVVGAVLLLLIIGFVMRKGR
ncbi:MAG: GlsB/YeaQ/YmgE family stress response membrane protein [Gammaproteobacteria bacterium]|nr:GlsB/YeaQ/YmgE family stress response membrane protein [Gammaproteobacteria bacterium]